LTLTGAYARSAARRAKHKLKQNMFTSLGLKKENYAWRVLCGGRQRFGHKKEIDLRAEFI
jgi:hypothetical protein